MNHIKHFYKFYNYVHLNKNSIEFILQILCFDTIIDRSIHAHIFSFNTHFDSNLKHNFSLSCYKSSNTEFKKLLQYDIPYINIYKNFITCNIYKDNFHSLYDSNFIRFYFIDFHFYDLYSFLYQFFPKNIVWDFNNNFNFINFFDTYLINSYSNDDIIYTHKYTFDDTYLFSIKYFKYFIDKFDSIIKDNSFTNYGYYMSDVIRNLCLDVPNYIIKPEDEVVKWFLQFYDIIDKSPQIKACDLYGSFIRDTGLQNISHRTMALSFQNKLKLYSHKTREGQVYNNIKRKDGL
jgi:hypothetical protein